MPKIKFDFFRVQAIDGNSISLKDALESIATMPPEERRVAIDGYSCFMTSSLSQTRFSAYLFTKLRMDGLPPRTRINGERRPLDLDDDEGLGEDVALAYCEALNIVSVQRNRQSLSANNIVYFIHNICPEINFALLPIMRVDALERFARCQTLKKLRIKLAGRRDLSFLRNSPLTTNDKVAFQQMMTEPSVDITFSVGRRNARLSEKISNFARTFTNIARSGETDAVLALEVSGKEFDDSPTVVIDLLQDKLIGIGDVEMENRTINTNHLMRVAGGVIFENYEELQQYAR